MQTIHWKIKSILILYYNIVMYAYISIYYIQASKLYAGYDAYQQLLNS